MDNSNESLGKKVRNAKKLKIPYLFVVGDKEAESKTISIESRDYGKLEFDSLDNVIARLLEENKSKKLVTVKPNRD